MKKFNRFHITSNPFMPELLSGLLWEFDIAGLTEEENALIVFAEENKKISCIEIKSLIQNLVDKKLIRSYSVNVEIVEDKNWNEEWEKNINVIEVSKRIVIKPSFRDYTPRENQIIITIDPKMSFGTGDHETTKLVLQLLEKYLKEGDRVLDFGSGTGVLSIAAAKLGAAHVIGIDNDDWCLLNGRENTELNYVSDRVDIRLNEITQIPESNFDLIVANINKHVLTSHQDTIKSKLKTEGLLIVSGILIEDAPDTIYSYSTLNFIEVESKHANEWIAIVFKSEKVK